MLGQIIPIIDIYKTNKSLRKKNGSTDTIDIPDNIEHADMKYLEDDYKATIETKNRFEDKAKTIIAALTIAITLILNLSKIIDTIATKIPIPYFNYVIFILAILCILYMMVAGIMSIQVLIKENLLFSISLEDRTNKNKRVIFRATQQNINQNLIRNNIIYASYLSIRNSVICLLIIFILAIYPYKISQNANVTIPHTNNGVELIYGSRVVEWLGDNSQKDINFNQIIEAYDNVSYDGTQKNIYDKHQGIIVTIELLNNSYYISDIKNDITEIN